MGNITSGIHLSKDINFEMKMTVTPRKHATLNRCNCILGNFKRHKRVDLDLTYITVQHSSVAYALAAFFLSMALRGTTAHHMRNVFMEKFFLHWRKVVFI